MRSRRAASSRPSSSRPTSTTPSEALGGRRFDIVYTGLGALNWLPDIERWASVMASLVAPGGCLYLAEFHPFTHVFGDDDLSVEYAVLPRARPAVRVPQHRRLREPRRGDRAQPRLRVEPRPRLGRQRDHRRRLRARVPARARLHALRALAVPRRRARARSGCRRACRRCRCCIRCARCRGGSGKTARPAAAYEAAETFRAPWSDNQSGGLGMSKPTTRAIAVGAVVGLLSIASYAVAGGGWGHLKSRHPERLRGEPRPLDGRHRHVRGADHRREDDRLQAHVLGSRRHRQQAHIHFGKVGINGGISAFLCSNLPSPPPGTPACPAIRHRQPARSTPPT